MDNSSSTVSSSTTTNNGEQYDVFLSFRGEDTRDGFTRHLYHALDEKQIKTFRDDKLVRGEEISEGLLSAIRESKISVVIFSENYAFSKWCLQELAEIMKYRDMNNQIVIPVFYKVDPSHVREQIGSHEAAFAKHDQNELEEEVQKWRGALTRASNLSGWDSSLARNEAEFVYDIVGDVWNKLNNIRQGLVGIDKHIEQVVPLLCLGVPKFQIIGIWGMDGMGKTTIADAVFHLVSHRFEKSYFSPSVRAQSEKDGGLIRLRDEIISKVLNEENLKIGSPRIPQSIKRRLNQKKVLIVLDDVDGLTNFEIFAEGLDQFGPESRIILTTRDKYVLRNCGVEDHNMYEVKGLSHDEAFQLFYNYAFKQNHPTKDFEVFSRMVVKIAKNVPLAIKVLGSLLYKKSKRDWENAVHKFQRYVNPDVLDVLRISYDGLNEEEKDLFLDITCFGEFAPDLSTRGFSLLGLIDKSLVTIKHGRITMHDLLREMGREIVDKQSPYEPSDRVRLLRQEAVLHTPQRSRDLHIIDDMPRGNSNDERKGWDIELIFAITNVVLECMSAIFTQLSSKQNPQYVLFGVLLSYLALLTCIIEIIYEGDHQQIPIQRGTLSNNRSQRGKSFATSNNIVALACALGECVVTTINYWFEDLIKLTILPIILANAVLFSKILKYWQRSST